jgi:hypothetical protein
MRVRGRYPYKPDFADRPIKLPILWQEWITDVPGGDGGGNEERGDEAYNDRMEENEEEGVDADDAKADDLSSTLTQPNQSGAQYSNKNIADNSFQPNTHTTSSFFRRPQLVRHPISSRPDSGAVDNLQENDKPTTITFKNPMTNPAELEAVMYSARQQPNWKAAMMEGESWEGTAEENIEKYQQIMSSSDTA